MTRYSTQVEQEMVAYYNQLNEPQKRQYAYLESAKLGHGGQVYICKLLKISPKTVRKGRSEVQNPDAARLPAGRQRRVGGGPKKKRIA